MAETLGPNNVINVKPKDLVVAFPMGLKNVIIEDDGKVMIEKEDLAKAVKNREFLAKRFGFSEKKDDGWCYARISNQMEVTPF